MTITYQFSARTLMLLTSLILTGCFNHASQTQGAYPTPNNTASGAVISHFNDSLDNVIANLQQAGVTTYQLGDTVTIVLSADNLFELDTPTINSKSYGTMDNVVFLLKQFDEAPIKIAGHSDNLGSTRRNKELSQQRADSILTYLWVHGIPFQQMSAIGYGDEKAIASNHYLQGSQANRRMEITVHLKS